MKQRRTWVSLLVAAAVVAGAAVSPTASAQHWHGGGWHGGWGPGWHGGVGVYIGPGWGWGPYWGAYGWGYPGPYAYDYSGPYYYPPAAYAPPSYIQQDQAPATEGPQAPASAYYWYHCDKPDAYYPYVKECPSGWKKVVPTPPNTQ
jgi:hypothetical protein